MQVDADAGPDATGFKVYAWITLGLPVQGPSRVRDRKPFSKEFSCTWTDKKWPFDMLSEVEWLVKEQAKINVILKKDDLILTGAYGFPVPINNNTLIKVSSSEFGDVEAKFKQ